MKRKSTAAARLGLGLALLPTFLAPACATRQPIVGQPVKGLDRKLSTHAYIEEGKLVTLIVDTQPARDRDGNRYLPLEIVIANNGLKQLTLTRESFVLIDAQGNRFPAASPKELLEGYEPLDIDRDLGELDGIVFNKFAAYARYPSNFSPTRNFENLQIVRDTVALPRFGYLHDFIYFPTPPGGIRDQVFELFVNTPELTDPVFVRFAVR